MATLLPRPVQVHALTHVTSTGLHIHRSEGLHVVNCVYNLSILDKSSVLIVGMMSLKCAVWSSTTVLSPMSLSSKYDIHACTNRNKCELMMNVCWSQRTCVHCQCFDKLATMFVFFAQI